MPTLRTRIEREHEAKILADYAEEIAAYERLDLSGVEEGVRVLRAIFGDDFNAGSDTTRAAEWLRRRARVIRLIAWSYTHEPDALRLAARAEASAAELIGGRAMNATVESTLAILSPEQCTAIISVGAWKPERGPTRHYLSLRHARKDFRGDRTLKLWVDDRGVLIWENGPGTVSPNCRDDRDAVLAHAKANGVTIEKV